jgi:hypothetical protein
MKSKRKHKHKGKGYYLSDRRAFNDLVRHYRKIYEMIKELRKQATTLWDANPF